MPRLIVVFISMAMALPLMTGCASKYGEQKTVVNYYPSCYAPIQDLRSREHDVATATAVGGVTGALGGALIGLLATGKAEGAIMGAAAGAASGMVAGNIYASKRKQAEDNIRLASYLQDIDGDISRLDIDGAAATNSLQCYDREFKGLVANIKARAISREAASKRFAEIMTGREEASFILGRIVDNARGLTQQYEQAFNQEEMDIQNPQRASSGGSVQAKKRTINAGRQKARQLNNTVTKWQAVNNETKAETSRQQKQIAALLDEEFSDARNAEI